MNKNIKIIFKKINSNLTHIIYKYKNKIFCFISCFHDNTVNKTFYTLIFGKPSNVEGFGAVYETLEKAENAAEKEINNYIDCITNM